MNQPNLTVVPTQLTPPSAPGEWTIAQIKNALSRPIPKSILKQKKKGRSQIDFIPWYSVVKILDKYAPGWSWEIKSTQLSADRIFIVGRLTIPAADGVFFQEASGTETLKEDKEIWLGEKDERYPLKDDLGRVVTEPRELAYGDPASNSESMAFRRAAAKFGLGLHLYNKD